MKKYCLSSEINRLNSLIESYTANETLSCFKSNIVEILENSDDTFIQKRVQVAAKLLSQITKVDYDEKIKSVYDNYNEAAIYHILKKNKHLDITNISESTSSTPDFKIRQNGQDIFLEMKSLAFGNGNLNYIEASHLALNAKIELETQHKRGRRICSSIREICPFHCKNIHEELLAIYKKVDGNIKTSQFEFGDTIMLFDLSQIAMGFEFEPEECVSAYEYRTYILLGRFWNLAFGKPDQLSYVEPEFEGKPNISEKPLTLDGIMNKYPKLKGVVFAFDSKDGKKKFYGLFRHADIDLETTALMESFCDFYNDDYDSFRYRLPKYNQ
jgi:hypothetical protein